MNDPLLPMSHSPYESVQLDRLSTFDNQRIGREFVPLQPTLKDRREHDQRKSQLTVNAWKEMLSLTDSQRMQKSSLKRACEFETHSIFAQSAITILVYVLCTCCAGAMIGWIIQSLSL
jgi:hypothetical protein